MTTAAGRRAGRNAEDRSAAAARLFNLHTVEAKVRKRLRDVRFRTMADALGLA